MNLTTPIYSGPQPGSPEQVNAIIAEIRRLYPGATCSLNFTNPLELLLATQLSAQCTDERVNIVTAKLFKKYTNVEDFAAASQEELEQDIRSTGFYRNKAKNIRATCQRLITEYNSEVPHTMEELLTLPGVARKTANVVLGNAFGIVVGFVVDTHVGRLARRFGWTTNTDPVKIEQELMLIVPKDDWLDLSHLLIFHGRAICDARRPLCEQCTIASLCPSAFIAAPIRSTTKENKKNQL
ncbi:endonuclease III [Dictyobacter arantiisoli]|uniref:Endonuclease III n=1 Tax=Dictyobacter arantiisoli TaxID=2014874 RepID=A0A5A5TEG8_9CHLR|nr:endonuclease III [Dictyobacter arantiisoli]GCF09473.1 endonuclease III [Dictyobacter arantiisoli]